MRALAVLGKVQSLAERPEGRIFIDFPAKHPHLATTLAAVRNLRLKGHVFVPALPTEIQQGYACPSLTFHGCPLPLEQVLPNV
jgi:hypothetical protein